MKLQFRLRGNTEPKTIVLRVTNHNEQFFLATKYRVNSKDFDSKKQRIKASASVVDRNINAKLNDIEEKLHDFFYSGKNNDNEPTTDEIKTFILDILNPKATTGNSFLDFFNDYIESNKTRHSATTGRGLTIQTQRKFLQLRGLFLDFSQQQGKVYDFKHLNYDFYNSFICYMEDEKHFKPNNIGKYINAMKTMLNDATKRGLNKYPFYKDWKILKEEVQEVALNEDELKLIENAVLPERLETARQVFLLGCWTGQRFSDYSTITPQNIDESTNTIKLRQKKTDTDVTIPILKDYIKEIIENKPKTIVEQVFNRQIKEICKIVGINDEIQITETKAGKRTKIVKEKWQMVSSHTARRTFATICIERNINFEVIRKVTGHKDLKSFQTYIKIDNRRSAEVIADAFRNQ